MLAFTLVAAWIYFSRDRKLAPGNTFLEYLIPVDVYLHADALRTYALVIINGLLSFAFNLGIIVLSVTQIAELTRTGLLVTLGPGPGLAIGTSTIIGFSIALFILQDFAFWVAHYLFHKVPLLWEFHKVHHCPAVLTPITDRQFHPLESVAKALSAAVFVGPLMGLAYYLYGGMPQQFTILGIAVVTMAFNIYGNFRHSHIWIEFPRWLSYVVSSPAMHHIHHSKAEEHWDKNMAVALSFWDYLFGTLYIPRGREEIDFGVADTPEDEFNSVPKLYYRPVQRAWQLLKRRSARSDEPRSNAQFDDSLEAAIQD